MADIKWDDGTTEPINSGGSQVQWDDGTSESLSIENVTEPSAFGKRLDNIGQIWTPKTDESVSESFAQSAPRVFQTGGQIAGMANDVVGNLVSSGVKAIYDATVPEEAQKAFRDTVNSLAKSGAGQSAIQGIKTVQDAYAKFKGAMPEAAANVEAVGNYAGIVPVGMAAKAVSGPAVKAAGVLKGAVTPLKTVEKLDSMIDSAIETGIKKGIRPSVIGKQNASQVQKYYDNAKMAVRDIIQNSPENLPSSLEDFSKAVLDTRKGVYSQYSTMAQTAGENGAVVDLTPIISKMEELGGSPKLRRVNSETADWLLGKANEWKKLPTTIDPTEAEDIIASLNSSTKSFWKNPNYNDTGKVAMTEGITKQLRSATDDAINAYQGPGYQELKNRYGALKNIEKEVTDRATIDARKNLKGFFDISDIASAGEFAYGLAKMDPASMVAAVTMRGMKNYLKHLNDPNRIIKDMFEKSGKLMKIRSQISK